jgi:NhaA family Na+:H+ antiporter
MTTPATGDAPRSAIRKFLASEAAGGVILMVVAALALVIANSPAGPTYFSVLKTYVLGLSVLHWINDALMAVFFLYVGLEIKRELLDGQLSTWSRRALPGIAALGGVVVPALIYTGFNHTNPVASNGWAIPTATDIAFALGVLALIGSRVPISLKILLTAIAIIDDLVAVMVIAIFYTAELSFAMLGLAFACLAVLAVMNRLGVKALWPYLIVGAVLWYFVLQSGVHATLAGVALAFTIPLRATPAKSEADDSPLHILEHAISPWVAFMVVPIFGFANAGVSLSGFTLSSLAEPVPLGIALGLFAGKQIGVFGAAWLAIRLGLAALPAHATWTQLYGVAMLCGIGFTMSLFIGLLAFPGAPHLEDSVKIGVLMGSIVSALAGTALLMLAPPAQKPADKVPA